MKAEEKLTQLEDIFDMKAGTLKADTVLKTLKRWDSMSHLSLIVLMDEEYGKKLKPAQIKNFITVQDILDFMG
ncbi:acyl carrier protein [Cloacibacillus evryensis]|uniref:Acyl carrier protein n=1 Tax=Cloacibacillus evryensis TaxID=508460 RepID=A0AAW5K8L5_9BACT|nr:acyl carrier protein [Cloacibacillus evryensis]MCQ4814657.1 acyl carrier protein [Cloacibacillus evryensis]